MSKITYEGPASKNPLAFKHYDAARLIENRTMAEHLRFSVAYGATVVIATANKLCSQQTVYNLAEKHDSRRDLIEKTLGRKRLSLRIN
jgi:xylose isomerase